MTREQGRGGALVFVHPLRGLDDVWGLDTL